MTITEVLPTDYERFLAEKVNFRHDYGFEVSDGLDVNPILFPHQQAIVRWAVLGGRRAIFAAFGLGKSVIQLETVRLTLANHPGRGLIICPLGVRQEFKHDAEMLGIETRFIRRTEEVAGPGIYITNYESVRDGRLDPSLFDVVSLDEASVLRSYGSKTFQTFLDLFADTPFKFVATATPSPNRHKELIHYAGFLGVMDTGQCLTRFFKRDSTEAGNLQLFPHKEEEFWLWLSSWSVFLQKPGDLGFSDDGYALPEHEITRHEVAVDHNENTVVDRDGQAHMFRGVGSISIVDVAREKRATLTERVAKAMEIIATYGHPSVTDGIVSDQIVLWCDLNDEQRALEQACAAAGLTYSSVYGSLTVEESERRLGEWKDRRTFALIGKPVMLGQGMNLQQCNKAVFVGITHKFNQVIQATHRIHRFGQTRTCHTHLIYAESERSVMADLDAKWDQHRKLTAVMSNIIRQHGLNQTDISNVLTRSMGVERIEESGEGWLVANNDCVVETAGMADHSVDLIVASIPFSNHYEYTPSLNDFGHTDNNDHFWAQMDHLTPNLLRILSPGRIYACHVKDRIVFGNVTGKGVPTVSPFHCEAILHAMKHGFNYLGMITVTTDVVRENNQTYRLGWTENAKDSTKMGVGSPEYVLLFRAPQTDLSKAYADVRVVKDKAEYTLANWQLDAASDWRSSGDRHLMPEELANLPHNVLYKLLKGTSLESVYDHDRLIELGNIMIERKRLSMEYGMLQPGSWSPEVWSDINRVLTLNTAQSQKGREAHVCPLQFDIVDRLIERYSNPGEIVFDPFGGLQTVPVRALKAGRRGRGVELNPGYFLDGVKYCEAMERQVSMPRLFDLDAS